MKIKLITIEGEPDEIQILLADFDLNEISGRAKHELTVDEKLPEHIKGPFGKKKERQPKPVTEPIAPSVPVVKSKRDKLCKDCGALFHDESKTNTRKWCDKCTSLKHKIDNKYIRQKPKTDKRVAKPKPDLTQNSGVVKTPSSIRPPIYLKANERICKNPRCKKVYKFEKLDQEFCSAECEKHKPEKR